MGRRSPTHAFLSRRHSLKDPSLRAVALGFLACITAVSSPGALGGRAAVPPAAARCSRTIDAGGDLAAAISAARAGSVLCLGTGGYDSMTLSALGRTADVTVRPSVGATVTIGGVTLNRVRHLRFTGAGGRMTIHGAELDASGRCSSNLTIDHVAFTSGVNVIARCPGMNILIDHDTFDDLGINTWEGRLNVVAGGSSNSRPVGVTISNSDFSGGCSDGIDVVGAPGVQIGPGNAFEGIQQHGCDPVHADPVQCGPAPGLLLTGNYFHGNGDGSGGVMCGNGEHDITIINNVFVCTCIYPYSIHLGGDYNVRVIHNTFAGGGLVRFEVDDDKVPTGNLVRDNVFTARAGISLDSASSNYGSNDHNLNAGEPGVGDLRGAPVFVGGKKPTTYAGFRLAPGSPGRRAASRGDDMGIRAQR